MNEQQIKTAERWSEEHLSEFKALLDTLCRIPAPSNKEEKRAAFCKNWLTDAGAEGVFIDDALNVVVPYCDDGKELSVYFAHTDTVFPDETPFTVTEKDGKWFCPGIGDNTVHLAELMMTVKFLVEKGIKPPHGMLFVCNSGEEGLGNLKGCREIIKNYGDRTTEFYSFDGVYTTIAVRAVGSKRYRVEVRTEGGHSFGKFGNKNAIHELAKIISELYTMQVPKKEGRKTTFNVGTIRGGTSVNTIAQQTEMLFEFRSDDRDSLALMESQFFGVLAAAKARGIDLSCEIVGERPCSGDVDPVKQAALEDKALSVLSRYVEGEIGKRSSSTDCNIPSSVGIPSVCMGGYLGGGAHTREEWLELSSLPVGFRIVLATVLYNA